MYILYDWGGFDEQCPNNIVKFLLENIVKFIIYSYLRSVES